MGWSGAETARRFQVTEETIAQWLRRVDDEGEEALVAPRTPVNKYPELVTAIVKKLHASAPRLGKRATADMLARASLKISASTVLRKLKETTKASPPPTTTQKKEGNDSASKTTVTAKRPHHLWHIDITVLGIVGLWLPWLPFALPLVWPFCWRIVVVVDHFSRSFLAFGVFKKEPTSDEVARVLERAKARAGRAPKHIVSDRGSQFLGAAYDAWCERHAVKPRYGAIGKHGSIAIVERFIRSLKYEHLLQMLVVPFTRPPLVRSIAAYQTWFNEFRPHQSLDGKTPRDVEKKRRPRRIRLEPRPRMPIPRAERGRVRRCDNIELVIKHVDGHRTLPVIELRASA